MLPRNKTLLLKSTIVRIAGLPDGGGVGGDAGDSWMEMFGDVGADFQD